MLPRFVLSEGFLYRICATIYPATILSKHPWNCSSKQAIMTQTEVAYVRVYRSGGKRHKQIASEALVFIINATMRLPRSDFQ